MPQRPQSVALLVTSTSQPLVGSRSQSAKPVAQTKPHVGATQVDVACARVGQTVPQPPQLAGSNAVFVHTEPLPAGHLMVGAGQTSVQTLETHS